MQKSPGLAFATLPQRNTVTPREASVCSSSFAAHTAGFPCATWSVPSTTMDTPRPVLSFALSAAAAALPINDRRFIAASSQYNLSPAVDPEPRTRASSRCSIPRIRELAAVERQASAPDTLGEAGSQAFEFSNTLIDPPCPAPGKLRPIRPFRNTIMRQLGKFRPNLFERHSHFLREHYKCHAPDHRLPVPAMP